MIRRPKFRIVSRPRPRATTTPIPTRNTTCTSPGSPFRKLTKPDARPSIAIANRSRTRSMNTVPKVRDRETVLLILSRYAR